MSHILRGSILVPLLSVESLRELRNQSNHPSVGLISNCRMAASGLYGLLGVGLIPAE